MSKLLFLLEDYSWFYTRGANNLLARPGATYASVLDTLIGQKYYQSDSMASAFRRLAHETRIVVPEANPLQLQWAKENDRFVYLKWLAEKPVRSFKSRVLKMHRNSYNSIQFKVLLEQVKQFKPEIIYVYSNIVLTEAQVLEMKKHCRKIVIQWAAPILDDKFKFPWHAFDLIVTAAIQLKELFEGKGYKVVYSQQAFDDSILEQVSKEKIQHKGDLVFLGSFSPAHMYRFEVLEYLLQKGVNITIHGQGKEALPKDSLVYKVMKEPLYGVDMYNEYRKYKMAVHVHITGVKSDAINWDKYAGAKRLFEITGIGTMMLAPQQDNLKELFEIDTEVVTFRTPEELLEKINRYLAYPRLIEKIAQNGMKRTLHEHSFTARARELSKELFKDE